MLYYNSSFPFPPDIHIFSKYSISEAINYRI
nr:MAG TPA: hypothetical protein [Caudoviricetes sp.]